MFLRCKSSDFSTIFSLFDLSPVPLYHNWSLEFNVYAGHCRSVRILSANKSSVLGLPIWPTVVRICAIGISSAFIFLVLCFKPDECMEIKEYEETGIGKLHHPTRNITAKKRQGSITFNSLTSGR